MRLAILLLGLVLAGTAPAAAQGLAQLGPDIPKATGEAHPEGNAYMRRHHMQMMKHDRNQTVHEGIRDINASLSECFECHSVQDEAGNHVTYQSEKHFCRTCHDFAAVKVDCFMCHRSTTEGLDEPPLHAVGASMAQDVRLAQTFLRQTLSGSGSEGGSSK